MEEIIVTGTVRFRLSPVCLDTSVQHILQDTGAEANVGVDKEALMSLFTFYGSIGQDKRVMEDPSELHFYEFDKFCRDIGLNSSEVGLGDVALAFERQVAQQHKAKKVIGFVGFVSALLELSFLRFGPEWFAADPNREPKWNMNGTMDTEFVAVVWCFQQLFERLILKEGYKAWKKVISSQKHRLTKIELPVPEEPDSKLMHMIFRHYTHQSKGKMNFECFLKFVKDFELHPQLCSRRAVARCFRSALELNSSDNETEAKGSAELTLKLFEPCCAILGQEIFDHEYVEEELRTPKNSFSRLCDLLRAQKPLIYEIETETKKRAKRKKFALEQRQRANRLPLPSTIEVPPPPPSAVMASATNDNPKSSLSPASKLNKKMHSVSTSLNNYLQRTTITTRTNHHITVHEDGSIDIMRLTPRKSTSKKPEF